MCEKTACDLLCQCTNMKQCWQQPLTIQSNKSEVTNGSGDMFATCYALVVLSACRDIAALNRCCLAHFSVDTLTSKH